MHATNDELMAGLDHVRAAPTHRGRLEALVIRPARDLRQELPRGRLDEGQGLVGDRWCEGRRTPPVPGMPGPESQLTLIGVRLLTLIARGRERWALAGDQLYVDLHLGIDNLQPGDRLRIGEAEIEISPKAHLGCSKFAARYGDDALALVNSPEGRRLRLRGIYAYVVRAGEVRVGDVVEKLAADAGLKGDQPDGRGPGGEAARPPA